MTSHKNVWRKSWSLILLLLRFYIFARMKLWDSPMKIHHELESVYGTPCSYDTVCPWIRPFQIVKKDLIDEPRSGAPKTAMNENAIELVRHACYSRWPTYWNYWNLLPLTWYNSPDYPWELGMKKGCVKWVPHFLTGTHKMERATVLNRCLPCLNRKGPNSWHVVTGDDTFISFYGMPSK